MSRPAHLQAYDNIFRRTGLHAIASGEDPTAPYDVSELTVSRNQMFNITGTAFGTVTAGNATFADNVVSGCHGWLAGDIRTAFGCAWVVNGKVAPYGTVEIRGTTLTYSNYTAIRVAALARNVYIHDNTVQHVVRDQDFGIDLLSSAVRIGTGIPRVTRNNVQDAWAGLIFQDGVYGNASFNAFSGNRVYGVWIYNTEADPGGTQSKQSLWWNDVTNIPTKGVNVEFPTPAGKYWHAECNWWNSALGPYDPTPVAFGPPDFNNNTAGQRVSDYFYYRELPPISPRKTWLNNAINAPGTVCLVVS